MVDGAAAVSVTQTSLGWATVNYNVAAPTHVVIYLHAESSSAPARIATKAQDENAGAYIQALKIVPSGAPTAVKAVKPLVNGTQKILHHGQLLIIRDGKIFNAVGQQQ